MRVTTKVQSPLEELTGEFREVAGPAASICQVPERGGRRWLFLLNLSDFAEDFLSEFESSFFPELLSESLLGG